MTEAVKKLPDPMPPPTPLPKNLEIPIFLRRNPTEENMTTLPPIPETTLEESVQALKKQLADADAFIKAAQQDRAALSKKLRAEMGRLITKQLSGGK